MRLTSQTKTIIDRVRQYFEGERRKGKPLSVLKRTAEATRIGTTTIKRIYEKKRTVWVSEGEILHVARPLAAGI